MHALVYEKDINSEGMSESVLQINDPTADDEGYYHCEATYSVGAVTKTISSLSAGLYSKLFCFIFCLIGITMTCDFVTM